MQQEAGSRALEIIRGSLAPALNNYQSLPGEQPSDRNKFPSAEAGETESMHVEKIMGVQNDSLLSARTGFAKHRMSFDPKRASMHTPAESPTPDARYERIQRVSPTPAVPFVPKHSILTLVS